MCLAPVRLLCQSAGDCTWSIALELHAILVGNVADWSIFSYHGEFSRFQVSKYIEYSAYTGCISLYIYCLISKILCIGQIEASTCPPGIPRAFDTFAFPGRREFAYQSLPWGGEFDPHALGVGDLNCTLDFM